MESMMQAPAALTFPHFPNPVCCFLFRNWNIVPLAKLAGLIGATPAQLRELAKRMGLPPADDRHAAAWRSRGYCTIIRQNWHLLTEAQLLELLELSAGELEHMLKEDDFLWAKLGYLKPAATPLGYRPPNAEEWKQLEKLRQWIEADFPPELRSFRPFEFRPGTAAGAAGSPHLRMIYPYCASYGDWLLDDALSDFPEQLLAEYQQAGINALWLQGLLYQLVPWPGRAPALSAGFERRRRNLQRLTERAAGYGIRILLYFNEPRSIPKRYAAEFADLKSFELEREVTLCTSRPAVLDYLRQATTELFRACPLLGGLLTITRSENPTNCASHDRKGECPRCAKRPTAEIIAELLNAYASGIAAAGSAAPVLAYTWAWDAEEIEATIRRLVGNISVLTVSEWGVPTDCGGYCSEVIDYSISHPGPSAQARRNWQLAGQGGLGRAAKIQINNSWEMSAVPYLPVFALVETHLNRLRESGVADFMLSWTLGGWPSPLIGLLSADRETIFRSLYGEPALPLLLRADEQLSRAFQLFPFDKVSTIYYAPVNCGPMNLLFASPTGYRASMVGFPYDDLATWRGIYPETLYAETFRTMSEAWDAGVKLLEAAADLVPEALHDNYDELRRYAQVTGAHFASAANQIAFILLRSEPEKNKEELRRILTDEIRLAVLVNQLQHEDAKIGFEASNHYYYTPNSLMEKVLNCRQLLESLH